MHSHLQPFCLYLMIHASKRSDFWIIEAFIYYKSTCNISTKSGFLFLGKWLMKFVVIYVIFCCNFIHIVECQCKNCYAFIKITKSEYSLIKEEFICSIHFMSWDEHIFYRLVNTWVFVSGLHEDMQYIQFSLHEDMQHIECGGMLGHEYDHFVTLISSIFTLLYYIIYYNLSFRSIL